jgi:cytochrome c oxidase cbb3-type subunit 3
MSDEIVEYATDDEAVRDGIGEDDNDIPFWFNATFIASIVFACLYIPYYLFAGWSSAGQYAAESERLEAGFAAVRTERPNVNPLRGDPAAIAAGKEVWTTTCVACHLPDGRGLVGPSLIDPYWKYGSSDDELFLTVSEGRPAGMPPWGSALSTEKIWQVLAFVETLPKTSASGVGAPDFVPPAAPGS